MPAMSIQSLDHKTVIEQLYEAKSKGLIRNVEVHPRNVREIYILLNEPRPESQKSNLVTYFKQHNYVVLHINTHVLCLVSKV